MKIKKLTASLLVLAALFGTFGCAETKDPIVTDDTTAESSPETTLPAGTDSGQPTETPSLTLAADGRSEYTIVYPDNAEDSIKSSAVNFRQTINRLLKLDKTSGISITSDWQKPGTSPSPDALEILVGRTNRPESNEVYNSLTENGYIIRVMGHKLVIAASHDNLLPYAMLYFENYFLANSQISSAGSCKIPADTDVKLNMSVPTLKQMLSSDFKVIAKYKSVYEYAGKDDFRYTQGSCTDGTYAYISLHRKNSNGVENTYIQKVRMSDWSVVATSEMLSLNHCNDMAYNPDTNKIVVANMSGPILTIIDPETLTVTETVTLNTSYTPYAITYNSERKQYVIAASGRFIYVDNDFKIVADKPKTSNSNYTGQGMDSDDNFIYVPLSPNSEKGTNDNIIMVFDWDCNLQGTVTIATSMESETMFNTGGVQYVSFNRWGSSKIGYVATIEYYLVY